MTKHLRVWALELDLGSDSGFCDPTSVTLEKFSLPVGASVPSSIKWGKSVTHFVG